MSDEKRDRNPWEDRYDQEDDTDSETSETSQESNTSKTAKTSKTAETAVTSEKAEPSKTSKTSETEETSTVRDRKNVNMYLPESLVEELQNEFYALEAEWRQRHGEDLPKNEMFYPAVIRTALENDIGEEIFGDEE